MNLAEKLKARREKYEDAGVANKIDRSKSEGLLEKLKILKKKKKKKNKK
jgi:Spy/CpxP family protein refolding chaperone